ncbi:FUSC family protein [Enterococcus gilvus]|uniref:FUSC family protein n=2 Tax=Enterococcus TaxID=1350 RepID=UPI002908BCAD|nr:FUSC family protein [Enterococcus gilvus]MDU5512009.1 FUSC family protein [Enterococcus gilvus]
MSHFQSLFLFNKSKDTFFRPLGSGLSIAIPILLSFFLKDIQVASLGVMGSFAYLSFQRRSVLYNVQAICVHGILLFLSFSLGLYAASISWAIPLIISVISFTAFILTKMYQIPKPSYSFIIMLFATGITLPETHHVVQTSYYLLFGIVGAIISGLLVSFIERLPLKTSVNPHERLSFKDKYYVTIYEFPDLFIKAINFSTILFLTAYISYLLRDYSGQWILISASSVLAGEYTQKIKERSLHRIIGTILGLMVGFLLIALDFPNFVNLILLIPLNIGVEYFMSRNYAVANVFINPQVLLLVSLVSTTDKYNFVYYRFISLIIGVSLTIVLVLIFDYSLKIFRRDY